MAKGATGAADSKKADQDTDKAVCGIIMPIAASDHDHPAEHWARVLKVLTTAIERANLQARPVWDGAGMDVIHTRILKGIFECEIALCDLSTRNANVMLEVGIRLSTKKPTILVAEKGTPLPFDTSSIHTEFYDRGLEWNHAETFIARVADQITSVLAAQKGGTYKSFMETFTFERVEPKTESITADQAVLMKLEAVDQNLAMLFGQVQAISSQMQRRAPTIADLAVKRSLESGWATEKSRSEPLRVRMEGFEPDEDFKSKSESIVRDYVVKAAKVRGERSGGDA